MKTVTSFTLNLAAAVLIVLTSATIAAAAAGNDTCAGLDASIGGTCTPLTNTTSGNFADTAFGVAALLSNTTGRENTAAGADALEGNTTGGDNTAAGAGALEENTTGGDNTATGYFALLSNITGSENTAAGYFALGSNTTGDGNTAAGVAALRDNTAGGDNTAAGLGALGSNTTGDGNTAAGAGALEDNTTGGDNTAAGTDALDSNTTGSVNIAVGSAAGSNLTTGSNNIDIGNEGVAAESSTIRIGTQGTQTDTFIAGIFGNAKTKGCEVVVESTGQLECVKSAARYKRDIHDMGRSSEGLMKLRPVTFRYKQDPAGTLQYGLVAEEVARVYPELVVRDADGKVESVSYWMLTSMLLNELQRQAKENKRLVEQVVALKKRDAQIDALAERMNVLERQARLARPEHLVSAMR